MPNIERANAVAQARDALNSLAEDLNALPAAQQARTRDHLAALEAALDRIAQPSASNQIGVLYTAVENVQDYAVITLAPDGMITSWNRGAQIIFGYTAAEVIGQPMAVLFTPQDVAAEVPQQELAAALRDGSAPDKHWQQRRDGGRFWADGVVSPIVVNDHLIGFSKILRDATSRQQLETERENLLHELATERAQTAAIIDQMPSGLAIAEAPSGKLVLHNQDAVRLLRHPLLPAADYTGYAQYGALHADGQPYLPEEYPIARALWGETVHQKDLLYQRGDGTLTYLSVSAVPVRDEAGTIIRAVSTFYDVGDRKRTEAELARLYQSEQQARTEAEQALQARDTFLAVAAHELRNPIAGLLGFAQLLDRRVARNPAFGERDTRAVHVIMQQAERLNRMIASLLDLARLETGRLELYRQPLDLCELAQRVVTEIEPTVEQHTLRYHCDTARCMVDGDMLRLEQVFYNLIQNAIKYSPNGGTVTVAIDQQPGYATMRVTDQGIGIPEAERQRLFDRFYRAGNASALGINGMGIGLYVVHEIVTLHGGTVDVHSSPGEGSTFQVMLPCMA